MADRGESWSAGAEGLEPPKRPGFPMDPHRVRRALWDGRTWLAGAAIVGLAVGFIYVKFLMGSSYETTVSLRHEGDISTDDQSRGAGIGTSAAADALMRESVLREIRDQLGFDRSLTSMADWISYGADPRTGTMAFTVSGETAEDAAEYAEVVTEVFMAYHRERQSRRIEAKIARTAKRIRAAEAEAEEARELYNAFRDTHGIADLSTEQQSMVESAAEYRAKSELAVSEIRAREAQLASLRGQLARVPKTNRIGGGTSPERATYNRLRQELASARATLSPAHPRVQALEQQVSQLRAQLRSGGGSSIGNGLIGVNASYQILEGQIREKESELAVLRERTKGLDEMAEKSRNRVQAFSGIEGEGSGLLAEVKVNEALVAKLQSSEAALEDALGNPPSGFVILDPGGAPEFPVENKMKLVIFLAIPALALLATLLVVLRREFHGLWVRTPSEVAFWGNGPVLAASSCPDEALSVGEIVAGLDDFVPLARGSLLVIGCSPHEAHLAGELADRLRDDWFVEESPYPPPAGPSAAPSRPVERGPLQTPPPAGPYPVPGSSGSVALARLPSTPPTHAIRLAGRADLQVEAWDGPQDGQALRRAARIADRVIVVVRSGATSAIQLHGIRNRLGRQRGIGFIAIGLADEFGSLPDRVGDVSGFWRS